MRERLGIAVAACVCLFGACTLFTACSDRAAFVNGSPAGRRDAATSPGGSGGATQANGGGNAANSGTSSGAGGTNATGTASGGNRGASNAGSGGKAAAGGATGNDAGRDAADLDAGSAGGTPYLYVSGYGPNISVFSFDELAGKASKQSSIGGATSPSYLALAPDKRHLYAIDENGGSKVLAFSVAAGDGHLTSINSATTGGQGAPHLSVHPSGQWLAVAHYDSGHTSVLPIMPNGGVGAMSAIDLGPNDGCKNAHQVVFDRSGNYLFVPCLGSNYVIQFKFQNGRLSYNDPATVGVTGGPRHFAFDPEQRHAYVISELESSITWFDYDASTGKLTNPQMINSYQTQKGASAHIVVHPNGKWLYASNRTENTIGTFTLDANGRPGGASFVRDMLDTPRDFTLDPSASFLVAANQNGAQNLLVYAIGASDGALTQKQTVAIGGSPTCVLFALLP